MNARELHGQVANAAESGGACFDYGSEELRLVVHALDLLARTEESTDEIVRELRDEINHQSSVREDYQDFSECIELVDKVNAALVALKAENDRLKTAWDSSFQQAMKNGHAYQEEKTAKEKAEAELASVRAQAEALNAFRDYFTDKCEGLFFQFGMEVIDLYNATHGYKACHIDPDRAAHPKDAPHG